MAKHLVKCKICGEIFDLNLVQGVRCGARRYAHYECFPEGELVPIENKEDSDLTKLKDYINKLFGDKANLALIDKQIKKFKKENNYSYSGMLKSLVYFYEIKKQPIDKSNGGIGIIPFIYNDAFNYYYSLFIAQEANKDKTIINHIKEYLIKPPKSEGTKKRFFNLGDDDNEK